MGSESHVGLQPPLPTKATAGLQRIYGRMRTHSRYEHSEIPGVVLDAALSLVCTYRRHVIRRCGARKSPPGASVEINKRPLPVTQLPGRSRRPAATIVASAQTATM